MAGKSVTLGQAIFELTLDTKKFKLQSLFAQKSFKKIGRSADMLGKTLATGLVAGIAVATAALVKLGVESAKTGAEFEQSIKTVSAIMGATDGSDKSIAAMESLSAEARRLGAETAYTATQAGDAMQNLARSGMTANQIIGASGPALMLAGASASTMSSATDLMASSMKQFGMNASEATRMTDAFTIVQQKTLMDMEHLTYAMRYGGTIASGLGMNIEETSAALGLFRDLGVEGSTAGTQFRQAMIQLAAPTRKAEKTLKKYGIKLSEVNPEVKSFSHVMKTLGEAGMTMGDMSAVVGKRAAGSIQKISKEFANGTTKFHELTEAMYNGAGTTEKTYNAMMDTVKGRFQIMKSAFQEFQLTMFDSFKAPLKELIGTDENSGVTGIINAMSEAMSLSANEMANGPLQSTMKELTEFFNENQAEIAAKVIVTIEQIIEAAKALADMLPTLIKVGQLMLTIWAASTITTWITTIGGAVVQLWRFVAGTRAASAAAVAFQGSLGWVGAISLAIGAVAAAIFATGEEADKAGMKAEILAGRLRGAAEAKERFAKSSLEDSGVSGADISDMKSGYSGLRQSASEQLGAEGLKNEKDIQRISKAYENMGEDARKAAIANGEMITIMVKGRKVAVKYKDALKFGDMKEQSDFYTQMEKAEQKAQSTLRSSKKARDKQKETLNKVNHALKNYTNTTNKHTKFGLQQLLYTHNYIGTQDTLKVSHEDLIKAVGRVNAAQASRVKTVELNEKKLANLTAQQTDYNNALEEEDAAAEANEKVKEKKPKKKSRGSGTDWKARRLAAEEATKARIEMENSLQREISTIQADGDLDRANEMRDQIKDIRKVYDQEIEAIRNTNRRKKISFAARLEIEQSYVETVLQLHRKMNAEISVENKKRTKDLQDDLKAEFRTRAEAITSGVSEDIKERTKEYKKDVEAAKEAYSKLALDRSEQIVGMSDTKQGKKELTATSTFETQILFVGPDGRPISAESASEAMNQLKDKLKAAGGDEAVQAQGITIGAGDVTTIVGPELDELAKKQMAHVQLWGDYAEEINNLKTLSANQAQEALKNAAAPLEGTKEDQVAKKQKELFDAMLANKESTLQKLQPTEEQIAAIGAPYLDIIDEASYKKMFERTATTQEKHLQKDVAIAIEHGKAVSAIEEAKNTDLGLITEIGNTQIEKIQKNFLSRMEAERLAIGIKAPIKILEAEQKASLERMRQEGASNDTILTQKAVHTAQMVALQDEMVEGLISPYGEYTEEIDRLESKAVDALTDKQKEKAKKKAAYLKQVAALEKKMDETSAKTAGLPEEQRAKAMERLREEMRRLEKTSGEASGSMETSWKEAATKIGAALLQTLSVVGSAVLAMGKALSEAVTKSFSFITGGKLPTSISGFLQAGTSAAIKESKKAKEDLEKLQEQLKSGEITQEQFDQQRAAGVGDAGEAGEAGAKAVEDKFNDAIEFAKALASGAPAILQKVAEQIPILVDSLVESIPKLIDALAQNLPPVVVSLIDGIIELLPRVVDSLVTALPLLVDGIVLILTEKLPQLLATLGPLIQDLVSIIVTEAPRIVAALVEALPNVVTFLVEAVETLLTGIPELLTSILGAVPTIITELLGGIGDIVAALLQAIPNILDALIGELPEILKALIVGLLGVIKMIAGEIPSLVARVIEMVPDLIDGLLQMLPDLITSLVEAIPDIIIAITDALPEVIEAVITLIPKLVAAILKALPQIVAALWLGLWELITVAIPNIVESLVSGIINGLASGVKEIGTMLLAGWDNIIDFFKDLPENMGKAMSAVWKSLTGFFDDMISELLSLGRAETATFGDTPEAIRAGASGMMARFAPNDLIVAAQDPLELLRQSIDAVGGRLGKVGGSGMGMDPNAISAMVASMGMSGANKSPPMDLTIMAEGRVLDEVQITAMRRGHAPKMKQKFKKASGVNVGFSRGRYNSFSGTR